MKTYIFGHKKPDTDSVMSSVALSYLENHSKNNTEARVLGDINKESSYALKYFKVQSKLVAPLEGYPASAVVPIPALP